MTDSGAAEVVRIDPVTSRRSKPIDVTPDPNDIAVGEGFVWTADSNFDAPKDATRYVSRIDPKSRAVKQIDIGARPAGIGTGDGYAWVTSDVANTVQTIDPRSGAIVGRPIAVGGQLEDIVVDHGSVWVAVRGNGEVAHIDPRTRNVDARIAVGPQPVTLAVGGGFLWVIDAQDGMLRRMSLRSRSLVGTPLRVDRVGFGVAYGEGRAWATASRAEGFGSPGTLRASRPDDADRAGEPTRTAGPASCPTTWPTTHTTYVWKTDKAWANSCRLLTVMLVDGTSHTARLKFTK